jgi:hypothetical protein
MAPCFLKSLLTLYSPLSLLLPSVPLYGPLSSLQPSVLSISLCTLYGPLPLNITLYPLTAFRHLYDSVSPLRPALPATALCLSATLYLL